MEKRMTWSEVAPGAVWSIDITTLFGILSYVIHIQWFWGVMKHIAIVLFALWGISTVSAATIRVPADKRSIQDGINSASDGDTILVSPGVYGENLDLGGRQIVLRSLLGNAVTTIQGEATIPILKGFAGDSSTVVSGFEIDGNNLSQGFYITGAGPIVENCRIHSCKGPQDGGGIYVFSGYPTIRNNVFFNNYTPATGGAICVTNAGSGEVRIIGNEMYGNTGAAPCIGLLYTDNVLIQRNLLYGHDDVDWAVSGIYSDSWGNNIRILNNTIYGNTHGIVSIGPSMFVVRNNIVAKNTFSGLPGSIGVIDYNDAWSNGSDNAGGPNGLSIDPVFVDEATNNFHLKETSPCINSGDPSSQYNDPNGTRNDMGALAFVPTHNPTILQVLGPSASIQTAIDSAVSGDTILVADGQYHERISFKGKKIIVASRYLVDFDSLHVENTIIDDSTVIGPGDTTATVRFVQSEDSTCQIVGLTLKRGGVLIYYSSPKITKCILIGGIQVLSSTSSYDRTQAGLSIDGCRLVNCGIVGNGWNSIGVTHCQIDSGISAMMYGTVSIDSSSLGPVSCRNGHVSGSHLVSFWSWSSSWLRQSKVDRAGISGWSDVSPLYLDTCSVGIVSASSDGWIFGRGTLIRDSVIINAQGSATFSHCTLRGPVMSGWLTLDSSIVDVSSYSGSGGGASEYAIVSRGSRLTIHCSNIWGFNSSWISMDPYAIDTSGVSFLSPHFCDPINANYLLKNSSPCAPANNAFGVQIGAYGVGCQNIAPQITSSDTTSVNEDARLIYRGAVSDPDGPTMTWSFINKPSWLTSSADSIYGTPHYPVHDTSFVIIASDGFLADTQTVSVRVHQLTPEIPIVRVDADSLNLHVLNSSPQISWHYFDPTGSTPQTEFEIAVGTDADWTYAEMWNPAPIVSTDSFVTYGGISLLRGHTYYLRLRAYNGSRWSAYKYGSFRLNSKPTVPVAKSPTNDQITGSTPILWVQNATDPEGDILFYDFQGTHDTACASGASIAITHVVSGTDSTGGQVANPLGEDCRYWWQVRSFDGYEYSDWSPTAQFRVNGVSEPPSVFTLTSPPTPDNKPVFTLLPVLQWNQSTDPDPGDTVRYKVELSLSPNFGLAFNKDSILSAQYQVVDSLQFGTRYWWRVSAKDKTGNVTMCQSPKDFWTWRLGDVNSSHSTDLADLSTMVSFLTGGGATIAPRIAGDLNADCRINLADLSVLVSYLTGGGAALKPGC